jgi:hypothetical protein
MKTTIIATSENKEVEIREDYFYGYGKIESNEAAKKLAELLPVLIRVERWVDEYGMFCRKIEIMTTIYGKDGSCSGSFITDKLLDGEKTIKRTFSKIEDAENWVKEAIEKIKTKRNEIIENVKKNKSLESREVFILV